MNLIANFSCFVENHSGSQTEFSKWYVKSIIVLPKVFYTNAFYFMLHSLQNKKQNCIRYRLNGSVIFTTLRSINIYFYSSIHYVYIYIFCLQHMVCFYLHGDKHICIAIFCIYLHIKSPFGLLENMNIVPFFFSSPTVKLYCMNTHACPSRIGR